MENKAVQKIQFVDLVFRQALHNLHITERERTDPIRYRVMAVPQGKLLPVMVQSLVEYCTKIEIEVDHLNFDALTRQQSSFQTFQEPMDRLWGVGHFNKLTEDLGFTPPIDQLFDADATTLDSFLDAHWPTFNPYAWSGRCIELHRTMIQKLLSPQHTQGSRALIVQNPDFSKRETFNLLYNLIRTMSEQKLSPYCLIVFAFEKPWNEPDPDRTLFFQTIGSLGLTQEPFELKSPNPLSLYRLLETLDLDENLAREKALDVYQFLNQNPPGDLSVLTPQVWMDAYETYLKDCDLLFHKVLSVAAVAQPAPLSPAQQLKQFYLFCQFEQVLEFTKEHRILDRPFLQYIDLMASFPANAHRYPEWLDAWLKDGPSKSRYVVATLHRELWFHRKNEEREQLHALYLANTPEGSAVNLQLISSWVLTLWRADHAEVMELGQKFIQDLDAVREGMGSAIAGDLKAVILLNIVVIEANQLEASEIRALLGRLYARRHDVFKFMPQLATELCFLFDFLWHYTENLTAMKLVELAKLDYVSRSCFNNPITLSNFATNLGSSSVKSGLYGDAIRYTQISQALAARTRNPRDIGIALLEWTSHRSSSGANIPVVEPELQRGLQQLIATNGSREHVLHYYQQTLWAMLCAREWDICRRLYQESTAYVEAHQLKGASDARTLSILGELLRFLTQDRNIKPEPLAPLTLNDYNANQAFVAHLVYRLLFADTGKQNTEVQTALKQIEGYVATQKYRVANSEFAFIMQALLNCELVSKQDIGFLARLGRIRYVETYFLAWQGHDQQKFYAESPLAQILLAGSNQKPILEQDIWLFVVEQFAKVDLEEHLAFSLCLALIALLDPVVVEHVTTRNVRYAAHRRHWSKDKWAKPFPPIWQLMQDTLPPADAVEGQAFLQINLPGLAQSIQMKFRTPDEMQEVRAFFEDSSLGRFVLKMTANRIVEIRESRIRRTSRKFAHRQNEEVRRQSNEISELLDQERRSLRSTLNELQKQALSRMKLLTSLFHDIKTPAQRTIHNLELALQEYDSIHQRTLLDQCVDNQNQIVSKLDKILLQSHADDPTPPQRSSVVWKDFCDKVCAPFFWEASRLQIDFRVTDIDIHVRILGVEDHFEIILVNVLSNALKFTPPGGRVRLNATPQGSMLQVTVEDNGIGMSEDQIASLGQPIESHDISFGFTHKGNGLGLSIVKSLIDAHEGTLQITSEPGKFTRVELSLPLDTTVMETTPLSLTHESIRNGQGQRRAETSCAKLASVLLIDSDPIFLEELSSGLQDSYSVVRAPQTAAAFRALQKFSFDFILCSYEVKPSGGLDVLQKLDSFPQKEGSCFLMLTSDPNEDARRISLENGAQDFIDKPISIHEIKQRLQNHLTLRTSRLADEHDKPDIMQYRNYRQYLADCFQNRKNRRPTFSHRRLMQLVGARSPSFFKRIIEGEVIVTSDMASRLAQVFGLSDLEKELFFAMVAEGREGNSQSKAVSRAREKLIRELGRQKPQPISALVQKSLWPAIILLLTRARAFDGTASWISLQLKRSIPTPAVQAVLDSFVRQGILKAEGQEIIANQKSQLIEIEESALSVEALNSLQSLTQIFKEKSSVQVVNILFPVSRKGAILALIEDAWMDFCSALRSIHQDADQEEGGDENEQEVCHISLVVTPCSHE